MKSEVRKFCGTKLICSLCVTFTENEMGNWKSFISLGEYPRSLLVILVSFSFNYGNNSTGNSTQKEGSQSNQIMTHISKNQIYYFPALNFSFTLFAVSPHSRFIPSPQPFTLPYFIANYLRKYSLASCNYRKQNKSQFTTVRVLKFPKQRSTSMITVTWR